MIYIKCPTCRNLLGNKEVAYYEGLNKINNNKSLTDKQKEDSIGKLLNSLHITNMCCRMRVINNIRMAEIIH